MIYRFRFLLLILLSCISGRLFAQSAFERVYGGVLEESAEYIRVTPDQGYILIGSRLDTIFHTHAYFLLKIDSIGLEQWSRSYADSFDSYGSAVVPMYLNGYAFIGTHTGNSYDGIAEVMTTDSLGNETGTTAYPPPEGWGTSGIGIMLTPDSNLAISTYCDGFLSQNYYSLNKVSSNPGAAWTNEISYDGSMMNVHGITQDPSGNYFTLGFYANYYYSIPDIINASAIRKINSAGIIVLDSLYELQSVSNSISSTSDGSAIVCGNKFNSGSLDVILTKLDSNGFVSWQKIIGGSMDEDGWFARQTSDGGYIVISNVTGSVMSRYHDIQMLKTNANGDSLWSRVFDAALDETALHIEETPDHGFILLGRTNSFGQSHIYLVKTDSLGIINSTYSLNSRGNYFCLGDTSIVSLNPVPPATSHVLWSNGDTTNFIQVISDGNYHAEITDSSGNTTRTPYYFAVFSEHPVVSLGIFDTVSFCRGSMLEDILPDDPSYSYSWFLDDTLVNGASARNFSPFRRGAYKLLVSNYCGIDSAEVFVDALFNLPGIPVYSSPGPGTFCRGDSFRISVLDTGLAFQWWYSGNLGTFPISGALGQACMARDEGTYFVQVNNQNGCSVFSDPFELYMDFDTLEEHVQGLNAFCRGGYVELSAPPAVSYQWSTGETSSSIHATGTGVYSFSLINVNHCKKYSDTVAVSMYPDPVVSLGPDTQICDSHLLLLDPGFGYTSYRWQDGRTTETFPIYFPGIAPDTGWYFVTITDTNGCWNSDTIQVIFDVCAGLKDLPLVNPLNFPNPAKAFAPVSITNISGLNSEIELTDVAGRLILRKPLSGCNSCLISQGLPPGYYIYNLIQNSVIYYTGRLIVQ